MYKLKRSYQVLYFEKSEAYLKVFYKYKYAHNYYLKRLRKKGDESPFLSVEDEYYDEKDNLHHHIRKILETEIYKAYE